MTELATPARGTSLVLSLFPGIDLFGRGFEAEGFCVVRGPDLLWSGDVRAFHAPSGRFDGIIGGPPCPDFSRARRAPPSGEGLEMLDQFRRVVIEARPSWWWLENVPGVPDVRIAGYSWLRVDLDAREFGSRQRRLRHFQFGHARGDVPLIERPTSRALDWRAWDRMAAERCAVASEGGQLGRRGWADFCELQGLSRSFDLPGMTLSARYRAVGNGVHVDVARAVARATLAAVPAGAVRLCACGCARVLPGPRRVLATDACRQRVHRRRNRSLGAERRRVTVTPRSSRAPAESLF